VSRVIHLVLLEGGMARPLCGEFVESRNWTTVMNVATCQACLGSKRRGAALTAAGESEHGRPDEASEPA
jgi:hypothetical protein